MWKPLAEILQQDDATREKILYYKTIAMDWMTHASVDILGQASPDAALHPLRRGVGSSNSTQAGAIQGYLHAGQLVPRDPFPAAPSNFRWGDGKRESRFTKATATDSTNVELSGVAQESAQKPPPLNAQTASRECASVLPGTMTDMLPTAGTRSRAYSDVAVPADGNDVARAES